MDLAEPDKATISPPSLGLETRLSVHPNAEIHPKPKPRVPTLLCLCFCWRFSALGMKEAKATLHADLEVGQAEELVVKELHAFCWELPSCSTPAPWTLENSRLRFTIRLPSCPSDEYPRQQCKAKSGLK